MNNLKSNIYIYVFLCILAAGIFGMYSLYAYVANFSGRVVEINTKLQGLQETKKKIELFKKILSKGSKEQEQVDSYILSGETVFKSITDIEKDAGKAGLFDGDGLGILSVTKRDNETLKALGGGEVVVEIAVEASSDKVDAYIQALSNLPFVSHIENVSLNYSDNKTKIKAKITLIITEIL